MDKLSNKIELADIIKIRRFSFEIQAYGIHTGETIGSSENDFNHYIAVVKNNN
jgi:hypothetical protein